MDRALSQLNQMLVIAAVTSAFVFAFMLLAGKRAKQASEGSGIDWPTEEARLKQVVAMRRAIAGQPAPAPPARPAGGPQARVPEPEAAPPPSAGGDELRRIIGGLHD